MLGTHCSPDTETDMKWHLWEVWWCPYCTIQRPYNTGSPWIDLEDMYLALHRVHFQPMKVERVFWNRFLKSVSGSVIPMETMPYTLANSLNEGDFPCLQPCGTTCIHLLLFDRSTRTLELIVIVLAEEIVEKLSALVYEDIKAVLFPFLGMRNKCKEL